MIEKILLSSLRYLSLSISDNLSRNLSHEATIELRILDLGALKEYV